MVLADPARFALPVDAPKAVPTIAPATFRLPVEVQERTDAPLVAIAPAAPDGMDAIRLMRPRRYHRVHTQPPADQPGWRVPDREELGFVAQEVQEALPHAVKPHDENTLALDLMALIAALTNAVKELDARLATMEARAA